MVGRNKRGRHERSDSMQSFEDLKSLSDEDIKELNYHLSTKTTPYSEKENLKRNIFLEAYQSSELKRIATSKKIPRSNLNTKTGRINRNKPVGKVT